MPASPELRNRSRDVGVVEVAEILESHHAAKAYGHVRISRKVEVDLEGVGDDAGPSAHSANIRATLCEHEVGKYAIVLASSAFLASPIMKRRSPLEKSAKFSLRVVI